MIKWEKIFQKDDHLYINISIFFKCFFVYLLIYIFSILEFNSIFDLHNFDIYKTSKYFILSLYIPIFYLLFSFVFRATKKRYVIHFLSFLLNDIVPLIIVIPFTIYLFFILKINFILDVNVSYLFILIICGLFILRKILDYFYKSLMNNNLIQRNIMLVGSVEAIQKILKEKDHSDKINIYKCCLIRSNDDETLKKARLNLKIPVFTDKSEVRVILEYHQLGQIWILDNKEKNLVNYYLDLVIKFSVDIIIVSLSSNLKENSMSMTEDLINNKYTYSNYQTSKFYGLSLLVKLFLDKILSILFLLLVAPILILSIILIYIEDGFPIFHSEESAGWDGIRFNVHKLRIYKKDISATNNITEKKILNIGKIIRKLRINEIPQFFNILKGDMSVVGPRPHILKDDLIYAQSHKEFLKRNKTFPGITGWAQVNGYRGKVRSNDHIKKKMEHDLWYMNNWSIWLDLYIICKTLYIILMKPRKFLNK
jgi:lipopolysaccharide/colanic/teichoic acid biosynthesis glycosyltransferase